MGPGGSHIKEGVKTVNKEKADEKWDLIWRISLLLNGQLRAHSRQEIR